MHDQLHSEPIYRDTKPFLERMGKVLGHPIEHLGLKVARQIDHPSIGQRDVGVARHIRIESAWLSGI